MIKPNIAVKFIFLIFLLVFNFLFVKGWSQGIAMNNNQEQYKLFESSILKAEEFLNAKEYKNAKTEYKNALKICPEAIYPKDKIEQINKVYNDPEDERLFNQVIENGNNYLSANEADKAKIEFEKAISLKPDDKYSKNKIKELKIIIANQQDIKKLFDSTVSEADQLFKVGDLTSALTKYQHADTLLPNEIYPKNQILVIQKTFADKKAIQENYDKSITDADNFYIARNFEKAKAQYIIASKLKKDERYPLNMIDQINSKIKEPNQNSEIVSQANIENSPIIPTEIKSDSALKAPNQIDIASKNPEKEPTKLAKKENEKTPEKTTEANNLLQPEKQKVLNETDRLKVAYDSSKSIIKKNFNKVKKKLKETTLADNTEKDKKENSVKKEEIKTPNIKSIEDNQTKTPNINSQPVANNLMEAKKESIIEKPTLTPEQIQNQENYKKIIAEGDRLLISKSYDLAIESYKNAQRLSPDESYPKDKINEIVSLFLSHTLITLNQANIKITTNTEKKFNFSAADLKTKKNSYILLTAKVNGNKSPKVFVNYGKDLQKNGGIVLKNITDTALSTYLIRISSQDLWIRLDNSWISLYPAGGDIEIETMQICNPE